MKHYDIYDKPIKVKRNHKLPYSEYIKYKKHKKGKGR